MLCEAWPQIEYLSSLRLGRLKEDYMMSYAGKERHVETEQLSRPSSAAPTPFTSCCVMFKGKLPFQVGAVAVYRTTPPHCRWIAR